MRTMRRFTRPGLRARSFFLAGLVILRCSLTLFGAPTPAPAPTPPPGGYLAIPLVVPAPARSPGSEAAPASPGFTRLTAAVTGVHFTNRLAESRGLTNHILLNGSGVALGDLDGDGVPEPFLGGLDGPNALYRNQGDGTFRDVTPTGLALPDADTTGVAFADVDGDGDLDVLVNVLGRGTLLFRNDGDFHFTDLTATAGTSAPTGSTTLALADVDGDGDLDLYVANYRSDTIRDRFGMKLRMNRVNGRLVVSAVDGRPTTEPDLVGRFSVDAEGNLLENGEADVLFLNEGQGRFRAEPFTGGRFRDTTGQPLTEPLYDWSLTAMFRDLNRDGWPDLYVCSDLGSPDRIWINDRQGHFQALAPEAMRKTSWFSMGIDFGDLNRDGFDDFIVTDMLSRQHRLRQIQVSNHTRVPSRPGQFLDRPQAPRNTLFLNQGDGEFAEIAFAAGLEASDWSWAPLLLDVDLDGFEDLLVVTGFERDVQDADIAQELESARKTQRLSDAQSLAMRRRFPTLRQPKLLFRNRGDLTFEELGERWGFADVGIAQGCALADLDQDGDLDIVANEMNGPVAIYRNNSTAPRVAVRLQGRAPNTQAIGARIRLLGGAVPEQAQEVVAAGRYLSCDDTLRVFAAGAGERAMRLEVSWRGGATSVVDRVRANHLYVLREPDATNAPPAVTPTPVPRAPLFEDRTVTLNHVHTDAEYDDFARQPLLPRKFSQAGPAVVWSDLDGDGWVDLVVGTGRGGSLGLRRNDQHGGFVPWTNAMARKVSRDVTGLLALPAHGTDASALLATLSNYEGADGEPASIVRLSPIETTPQDAVPPQPDEPGSLALADIDGDGDLDLFVGGRLRPGRYPEAADSRLYRREPESWRLDTANQPRLTRLGLVTGAVFTDLDGDGYPELAVATEWGPIRVFQNDRHGGFTETTEARGLAEFRGWWQGVQAADFDGDGRMDLVASNWGLNTRYRASSQQPLALYFGDLIGDGGIQVIETYWDAASRRLVPWHHFGRVRAALPFLQERFANYRAFADAGIADILGDRAATTSSLTATWLASTLFLNRGPSAAFEARPLPAEAQRAPAFGVAAGDLDGDGFIDLFLAQNFFATDPEVDRHDGGRGLLLRGDGRGGLQAMPGRDSGIRIYGEQRGAALADYDHDGRWDLAVGQNAAATRLFHNARASVAMSVRLRGTPGNPTGIGAQVRLESAGDSGPTHELHAGSGYLSQDEAVLLLPVPSAPATLVVRWPGGATTRTPVATGTATLEIRAP